MNYHAHIYFLSSQISLAETLRQKLSQDLSDQLEKISPLFPNPLGPHPIPTFEIHFSQDNHAIVLDYLKQHREGLSVLIHQDTGDDILDHSENILWLGSPVDLDFDFFEKIKQFPELRINK